MSEARLYCGTSGFDYTSWKPGFYPEKLPRTKFLSYYAERLNTVEINYTYRQIAKASTFEKWIAATPENFIFLPKAHMRITHVLKLDGAEKFTRYFLESLEPLRKAERLGPILFQLAPSFKADIERLKRFANLLPKSDRAAFEFRHESWFDDEVYEALRDANVALCLAENEKLATPRVLTADFAYLRLRKPDYSDEELADIGALVAGYRSQGHNAYAIFKHEETPAGALYAERLLT